MRRTVGVVMSVLAIAGGVPAATAVAEPRAVAAKSCSAGYVHAVMRDGAHKCLRAGQYCARRNESVYRRKGFTCRGGRLRYR